MNTSESTYWHIQIRPKTPDVFNVRAERFAFLNVWRTYFLQHMRTCAYVLLPGHFSAIVSLDSTSPDIDKLTCFLGKQLQSKLNGIFSEVQIQQLIQAIEVNQLYTEKDCIYKTFDLHTIPQKYGFSTDYRNYPFSSYKALANGHSTQIDQKTVWSWFGGKNRFCLFHQAYYGWVKPDLVANAS